MARHFEGGRLIVASHNPGKVSEIEELLAVFGIDCVSAGELGLAEPEETAPSFAENAALKALAAARAGRSPALADDSGLVVQALDGAPGIYSARWAGPDRDFGLAMAEVENRLRAAGARRPEERRAAFVSALTLAWPDGQAESFEGRVEGSLVWPPRGKRGFGYDPVFLPDGGAQTFGEMVPEAKHAISHRAVAFRRLTDACFEA